MSSIQRKGPDEFLDAGAPGSFGPPLSPADNAPKRPVRKSDLNRVAAGTEHWTDLETAKACEDGTYGQPSAPEA